MKQLFLLTAIFAGTLTVLAAPLPPAERLLPADTLALATVPDWTVTGTNFSSSALGRFFNDPAMKPFREKLVENFVSDKLGGMEQQLGIKFRDYSELARGQMTLALTKNGWDGSPDKKPGFLWLIDTRDKAGAARTNISELTKKWIDKGNKLRSGKVRDVDFTTLIIPPDLAGTNKAAAPLDLDPTKSKTKAPTELLIGLSDTLLILSDSQKDVEKVLALQSGSSVPPIAEQAAFAANSSLMRDAGAFAWVDVKSVMAAVSRQAREEASQQPPSTFGAPPTFDRLLTALGLADVQTIGANYRDGADGATANVAINVPEASRKGLLKILAVDQKDSSPPPFVPADAVKFSRWRIDLQKAWTAIENMMNEISPASGGVLKLLLDTAGKDKDPNFDLRKVLLANLGDDVISYEKAARPGEDPAKPPSVFLVGSKSADQMAASLKALTSIIPPSIAKFQEREFLGRKVCSFTWPSMTGGASSMIHYSASGGYVAISSDAALVEEYLRSNEGKNKPLRETVGLTAAAQKVGGMNSGFFAYENQNESMRAAFESAKKDPTQFIPLGSVGKLTSTFNSGTAGGSSITNWFDASLLPAYDKVSRYFHLAVSAVNVSPGAVTFKMYSPTPPQLRN